MDMEFRKRLVNCAWEFINKYNLDKNSGADVMFGSNGNTLELRLYLPNIVIFNISVPLDDIDEDITVGELHRRIKEQLKVKSRNWDIDGEFAKIYDPEWHRATSLIEWLELDEKHLIRIVRS